MVRILGVNGSTNPKSRTLVLVKRVLASAEELGATTSLLELGRHPLPVFSPHGDSGDDEAVRRMIGMVSEADALVVGSPEYHGSMSGATKNFFDYLYREIAGKLFGLVAAAGGGNGTSCFTHVRAVVQHCHGWTLPYNVGACGSDFDKEGALVNARVDERLRRMGRDLVVYGPLLHDRFKADLAQPADEPPGFAHWMA